VLTRLTLGSIVVMAAPAAAAPKVTTTSTTVAQWSMSESTSQTTMADSSGNGNNGSISAEVRRGQPGFSGNGYGFAGDGGRVTVPSSSTLNPGSSAYTVSLYFMTSVKPNRSVGDYDLIRKGLSTTSGGDWKVEVLGNGHVFCHFRGSSGSVNLTGSSNIVNGAWHSIVCSSTSTGTTLVVDGKTQAKTTARSGSLSNSASLMVGAKNATEDLTTGTLDEITITKTSP
jgi:hypothetical protein